MRKPCAKQYGDDGVHIRVGAHFRGRTYLEEPDIEAVGHDGSHENQVGDGPPGRCRYVCRLEDGHFTPRGGGNVKSDDEMGSASCRERGVRYVYRSVAARQLKKKMKD